MQRITNTSKMPSPYKLTQSQQCRLQQLSSSQPSQRIESEGGITELWNENEDQFQCTGVAPMRNTWSPNALSLPNYHPAPRLVYIEQGERTGFEFQKNSTNTE
ncbi:hypothetical protein ACSBR2_020965 [Camellia fascicularis]